jgi:hypothetical protein
VSSATKPSDIMDLPKGLRAMIRPGTTALYPQPPSELKDSAVKAQHLAVDVLRWISLQLTGTVCSAGRMVELIRIHRELVGLEVRAKSRAKSANLTGRRRRRDTRAVDCVSRQYIRWYQWRWVPYC